MIDFYKLGKSLQSVSKKMKIFIVYSPYVYEMAKIVNIYDSPNLDNTLITRKTQNTELRMTIIIKINFQKLDTKRVFKPQCRCGAIFKTF